MRPQGAAPGGDRDAAGSSAGDAESLTPLYAAALAALDAAADEVQTALADPTLSIERCVQLVQGLEIAERKFAQIRIRADREARKLLRGMLRNDALLTVRP